MRIQIAVDCEDPHELAYFWAEALGYEVTHNDDFIRGLIAEGHATEDQVIDVRGHLQFKDGAACEDPETLRPRLYFQLVPESKSVKNRLHLDLQSGPDRREAEADRLEGLGATRLYEGSQGPHRWITMADPEGNEFCVS